MSAFRLTLARASKVAARGNFSLVQAARPISTSARLYKPREIISEKEIPVSSYTPDGTGTATGSSGAQRSSIPVRPDPTIEVPVETNTEKLVPLTKAVYDKLPGTLQKMTVMDKLVIVTG